MLASAVRQGIFIVQARRHERLARTEIERLQAARLRRTVQHAAANSPFYRDRFAAVGLRAAEVRTITDLAALPPTTKLEVQEAGPAHTLARGFTTHNTVLEPTSGSSGTVLQIYHARAAYDRYFAFAFRHLWQLGYRPWQRVAYTAYDPLPGLPWTRLGLGRREQVDLRQRDPRRYVQDLLRIQPDLITAYPSILRMVIQAATPAELARIRPRAIHLHSELLTDGIRAEIKAAFGTDCFDDYSTFEFHHVAYECRAHSYHIAADNVIVEVVREGRPVPPGEPGELLLTGLTNDAMPLLRYAIGDVGALRPGPCACGSGFPAMQLVEGRVDDFVVLPSGRRLSPRMINPVFENLPGLLEHVLIQEAPGHFVAQLNVSAEHRTTTPDRAVDALRTLFGESVRLDVALTTEVVRGRTGKLRCIVSRVGQAAAPTSDGQAA